MVKERKANVWTTAESRASDARERWERAENGTNLRGVRRRSILQPTDRGRQVTRLLDILRALESAHLGLTVEQLLEQLRLNSSQRTVYRDLDHLETAGFPIERHGSRFVVSGRALASETLPPSQILSLLLAEDFLSPLQGSAIQKDLSTLRESLRSRLSWKGRAWIDAVRSTIAATTRAPALQLTPQALDALQEALVVEQLLCIEYAAPDKPTQCRIVEPHLLNCEGDDAYLVAYCQEARAFRTFALQRIRSAELLDDTFERRSDFDPTQYVGGSFGAFHGAAHEVLLRFHADVAHLAHERRGHNSQTVSQWADGSVDVRMTAEGLSEIAAWVASFGGQVRALAPEELRSSVRRLHEAGLQAHCIREDRETMAPGSSGEHLAPGPPSSVRHFTRTPRSRISSSTTPSPGTSRSRISRDPSSDSTERHPSRSAEQRPFEAPKPRRDSPPSSDDKKKR